MLLAIEILGLAVLVAIAVMGARWLNIRLYNPQDIWSTAIFQMDDNEDMINHDYSYPDFVFSPWRVVRDRYHYCTGYADPFLFVKDDFLYLFYEEEIYDGFGRLKAKRTSDMKTWEDLGVVLQEPFHLSYPNVFEYKGEVYMLPEVWMTKTVTLYKAENFPYDWKPVRELVSGHKYVDSDLFERDGIWYLFTTVEYPESPSGLRLYTASGFDEDFVEHPSSPLSDCTTLTNWRCGGSIFEYRGKLYRPAQKSMAYYGENLGLWEITSLDGCSYKESFARFMHPSGQKWDSLGGHHFKSVIFKGKRIVAMDGIRKDSWINNRTRGLFKKPR